MAVYINNSGVYTPGLAATTVDGNNFDVTIDQTAHIVGLVFRVHAGNIGDVILQGVCKIDKDTLDALSLSGDLTPGTQIYLGGDDTYPGYITQQRPALSVPIATVSGPNVDDTYTLVVNPGVRDVFDHTHYHVQLAMAHGTNSSDAGWLDCASSSDQLANFPGKVIPLGAKYGYNIPQDSLLYSIWPPMPMYGVYLERNGEGIRMRGSTGEVTCQVDEAGIWWMDSCSGQQPFGQSDINPGSGCITYPDQVELWMSKMPALTDLPVITSLSSLDNSITIKNYFDQPATTGNLRIGANLPSLLTDSDNGYSAVKELVSSAAGNFYKTGPIVAGIRSVNPDLTITGSVIQLGPDPDTSSTESFAAGYININYEPPGGDREGALNVLTFDNVEFDTVADIPMYVFRTNRNSTLRGQVRVPTAGVVGGVDVSFMFTFYSAVGGTFPDLTLTKRIISAPAANCSNYALPLADAALETLSFASCAASAGCYFTKETAATVSASAGDIIYLNVTRSSGDAYPGDVDIIDIKWSLD
jgi:hypothetical protein